MGVYVFFAGGAMTATIAQAIAYERARAMLATDALIDARMHVDQVRARAGIFFRWHAERRQAMAQAAQPLVRPKWGAGSFSAWMRHGLKELRAVPHPRHRSRG